MAVEADSGTKLNLIRTRAIKEQESVVYALLLSFLIDSLFSFSSLGSILWNYLICENL
jgi:hypothetical protein